DVISSITPSPSRPPAGHGVRAHLPGDALAEEAEGGDFSSSVCDRLEGKEVKAMKLQVSIQSNPLSPSPRVQHRGMSGVFWGVPGVGGNMTGAFLLLCNGPEEPLKQGTSYSSPEGTSHSPAPAAQPRYPCRLTPPALPVPSVPKSASPEFFTTRPGAFSPLVPHPKGLKPAPSSQSLWDTPHTVCTLETHHLSLPGLYNARGWVSLVWLGRQLLPAWLATTLLGWGGEALGTSSLQR
uniref:Uncharacterized protein n=1 Tax=Chelonoidis abingdonii TaxID=106734 RepID=A0A8C0GJ03_CHEAB